MAPEVEHLQDTGLSMSFSVDAKRVINEPFDNVRVEQLSPSRDPSQSEPLLTPKIEPPSPMSNTPLREIVNCKQSVLEKFASRKRELKEQNTPTRTPTKSRNDPGQAHNTLKAI